MQFITVPRNAVHDSADKMQFMTVPWNAVHDNVKECSFDCAKECSFWQFLTVPKNTVLDSAKECSAAIIDEVVLVPVLRALDTVLLCQLL